MGNCISPKNDNSSKTTGGALLKSKEKQGAKELK